MTPTADPVTPPPGDPVPATPPPGHRGPRLALHGFGAVVLAPALFLALARLLGLLDPARAGNGLLVAGAFVALMGCWFVGFLGESWIEDLVKTAMVGALLYASRQHPLPAAVVAGLTAGFATSTILKFVQRELPARQLRRARDRQQAPQDPPPPRHDPAQQRPEQVAPTAETRAVDADGPERGPG